MEKEKLIVESVKLALANLQLNGVSPKEVLISSIRYLMECCSLENSKEGRHTEETCKKRAAMFNKAILFIEVYIELGFSYESHAQLFEQVFRESGLTDDEVLFFKRRFAQKLKLNKSKIGSVLGRWNPRYHSNTKKEVVEDILEKIRKKEPGEYFYYSRRKNSKQEDVYQLVIGSEGSYFCHVNEQRYYEFENMG